MPSPWRWRLARGLEGRPTASRAGTDDLALQPVKVQRGRPVEERLAFWLPCSRRGQSTAVGLLACGCVSARYAAISPASQGGSGTCT